MSPPQSFRGLGITGKPRQNDSRRGIPGAERQEARVNAENRYVGTPRDCQWTPGPILLPVGFSGQMTSACKTGVTARAYVNSHNAMLCRISCMSSVDSLYRSSCKRRRRWRVNGIATATDGV